MNSINIFSIQFLCVILVSSLPLFLRHVFFSFLVLRRLCSFQKPTLFQLFSLAMAAFCQKILEKVKETTIISTLLDIEDTFLANKNLSQLLARFSNPKPRSIAEKLAASGLLQASCFPKAYMSLELILAYRDRYDTSKKCIHAYHGEVLVYVTCMVVMGALRIPPQEIYEDQTISSSHTQFSTDTNEYNNTIAKYWLFKLERGGSQLQCPLTREHMILEIKDIITLLNKVKGNPHAFHWENWMYFFIYTTLGENKFIDQVDIILTKLKEEISQASSILGFTCLPICCIFWHATKNGKACHTWIGI